MEQQYSWYVTVLDAKDNKYIVAGYVVVDSGDFVSVIRYALSESFTRLTNNDAEYGKPGQGGCTGPYKIDRVEINRVKSGRG